MKPHIFPFKAVKRAWTSINNSLIKRAKLHFLTLISLENISWLRRVCFEWKTTKKYGQEQEHLLWEVGTEVAFNNIMQSKSQLRTSTRLTPAQENPKPESSPKPNLIARDKMSPSKPPGFQSLYTINRSGCCVGCVSGIVLVQNSETSLINRIHTGAEGWHWTCSPLNSHLSPQA